MKNFSYSTFCIILVNSTALAFVALYCLGLFADSSQSKIYSEAFNPESYSNTTDDERLELWKEFDAMGEQESYQSNPWTTFIERPFHGKFLNVVQEESYPTRKTIASNGKGGELLVWAFGGSTMFGWGVSDKNTIASHLQTALQEKFPTRKVRVINHGHSYYHSSLEVSLFVALLRQDKKPEIAIFLDGLNDTWAGGVNTPYFAPQAAKAWEDARANSTSEAWFETSASFPLNKLARNRSMNKNAMSIQTIAPKVLLRAGQSEKERINSSVSRVSTNMRLIETIGRRFEIDTFTFLQPLPGEVLDSKVFSSTYDALKTLDGLTDISYPLRSQQPYVDNTHYSDSGCAEVAARIAERIVARN